MWGRVGTWWDDIKSSLWFIPSLFMILAIVLSTALIAVDRMLAARASPLIPWLFSGTADAARTVLSVIAGSLITVISIAISLTIVALVQASAQWTPRILRQFTASRPNQVVLGAYAATFVYALLVLRAVRSPEPAEAGLADSTGFVPALSVSVSIGLALICLALLVFFIHHTAQSFEIARILDRIRHEFVAQLDHLYPAGIGAAALDPAPASSPTVLRENAPIQTIRASQAGFVRRIDEDALLAATGGAVEWIWVHPQIGTFVACGAILAEYTSNGPVDDDLAERVQSACIITSERTTSQDPLFAIRQIVDVGLRALSPGINDVTTAEYAFWHLGDMLGRLADRPFPSAERRAPDRGTYLLLSRPTWAEFVAVAFDQLRRASQDDVHATQTLLGVLIDLASRTPPGLRREAIDRQLREIRHALSQGTWSPGDAAELQYYADRLAHTLTTGTLPSAASTSGPTHSAEGAP